MSQEINDDMTVAGKVVAADLDGHAVGVLREEFDALEQSAVERITNGLADRLDAIAEKLDVLIEIVRQAGDKKETEEVIL